MGLGIEVSVISILTVFLTLYLLAIITNFVKFFIKPKANKEAEAEMVTKRQVSIDENDELVAVITAAIQSYESTK